jgi:hypothetical protein
MNSKFYRSFEEFAREEIRPMSKIGWSLEELDFHSEVQSDELNFSGEDSDSDDDE